MRRWFVVISIILLFLLLITGDGAAGMCPPPWDAYFEIQESAGLKRAFNISIKITSSKTVSEGRIVFTPLVWNNDTLLGDDAIGIEPKEILFRAQEEMPFDSNCGVYFSGKENVKISALQKGRMRVKADIYDAGKLIDTQTLYIESGDSAAYCSTADFFNADYVEYLSGLSANEKTSKKALRGDAVCFRRHGDEKDSPAVLVPLLGTGEDPAIIKSGQMPVTVEEAVRATGGTYGVVSGRDSVNDFSNVMAGTGITAKDSDYYKKGMIFSPVDVKGVLIDPSGGAVYDFFGPQGMKLKIRVKAEFIPLFYVRDFSGKTLADSGYPPAKEKNTLTLTLPYTGKYRLEIFSRETEDSLVISSRNGAKGDFLISFEEEKG